MFLKWLFNIVFPKPKKPLIVDFIGPYGVGKTYLLKKIHFKYSLTSQTKNFAIGIFRFFKLQYSKTYQIIEDEFKKYPELSNIHLKYLTGELCARSLDRVFYIDEAIINTFPTSALEKFYKHNQKLLSEFYKNTIVIYLTDSLPNIQKKLKSRRIKLKTNFKFKKSDNNFYNMHKRIQILKNLDVPILTLNASAPIDENIIKARAFIKQYRK